jgi:hypothetical protein
VSDKLNDLQNDFLKAFFDREARFYLTGGAALVGFHLGHRETRDLDLFTLEDALEAGAALTAEIAREWGATLEPIQTYPDFRRLLLKRNDEAIIIDLVRERVVQIASEKLTINRIRVDPPEEILANKLCALLSRSEVRDLVDVQALEASGLKVEDAITSAALKDTSLTPGQLSWVLSQIELGDDLTPPGHVSTEELRKYLAGLIARLTRLALPNP